MTFSIDESSDFGARAATHLKDDAVVWLTTVGASGTPAPNPVWFVWDGDSTVRVFSQPTAAKLDHLRTAPRVSLNFAGDGHGGDIVVLAGSAVVSPDAPAADALPDYLVKYGEQLPNLGMTPEAFAQSYSEPIVITLDKLRGH